MIGRDDFVFIIGYDGDTAIVDSAAQRKYRRLAIQELLEEGQYRAALRASEYDQDEAALQQVLEAYNTGSVYPVPDLWELRRVFGVFGVPDDISKVERI